MSSREDDARTEADNSTDMGDRAREAFRSIPEAPLKAVIEEFLATCPDFGRDDWLRKIAALNQGGLGDLDGIEFKSYVLYRTGLSELELLKCRLALRSFVDTKEQAAGRGSNDLLVAARGDQVEKQLTSAEVLEQLKKRLE